MALGGRAIINRSVPACLGTLPSRSSASGCYRTDPFVLHSHRDLGRWDAISQPRELTDRFEDDNEYFKRTTDGGFALRLHAYRSDDRRVDHRDCRIDAIT